MQVSVMTVVGKSWVAVVEFIATLFNSEVVCTENWIRLDARQRLGNPAT
jgi:hypothetical protein